MYLGSKIDSQKKSPSRGCFCKGVIAFYSWLNITLLIKSKCHQIVTVKRLAM